MLAQLHLAQAQMLQGAGLRIVVPTAHVLLCCIATASHKAMLTSSFVETKWLPYRQDVCPVPRLEPNSS